jgi:hypothetical protein
MERVARTTIAEQTGIGQANALVCSTIQEELRRRGISFWLRWSGPRKGSRQATQLVERTEACEGE